LDPPADLLELLKIAAQVEEDEASAEDRANIDFEEVPAVVAKQLLERKDMLSEYFSINISENGQLETIPLLLRGYIPSLAKLPRFLLRLGPYVDWSGERECFHTFLKELAAFYVPEQLPPPATKKQSGNSDEQDTPEDQEAEGAMKEDDSSGEDEEISKRRAYITWSLEHTLFPAFKARLVATKGLLNGVVEVANLKGLYRVFERC
jgi:DNA mismatch repair protein MLH1